MPIRRRAAQCPILGLLVAALCGVAGRCLAGEPGCPEALAALQDREAAALAGRHPADQPGPVVPDLVGAVKAAQRLAARACLGPGADLPQPPRSAPAPMVATPPSAWPRMPTGLPTGQATGAPPSPALTIPPLRSVTGCDPLGCWSSDGGRYLRFGPQLIGPGGLCVEQGLAIICPGR